MIEFVSVRLEAFEPEPASIASESNNFGEGGEERDGGGSGAVSYGGAGGSRGSGSSATAGGAGIDSQTPTQSATGSALGPVYGEKMVNSLFFVRFFPH